MQEFTLTASDGWPVAAYHWDTPSPKAVVHIAHGMGEHAQRYDWVARGLNEAGYRVYANDHRGHGKTADEHIGYMGPDGWNRVLADTYEFNRYIAGECPGVPIVLLGHSMGAMISQQYITRHGYSIDGLILSGSPGFKAPSRNPLPRWILKFEQRRLGPEGASGLMQKLLFGSANKPFDGRDATGFEWLSRDPDQVRAYVDDPLCGFVIATGSLSDMYAGVGHASNDENLARLPRTLPTFIFAGTDDPVHGEQEDILRMVQKYTETGLSNLTVRWYAEGRHEMFNETNRDEVLAEVVQWLDTNLPGD